MFEQKINSRNFSKRNKSKMRKKLDGFIPSRHSDWSFDSNKKHRVKNRSKMSNEDFDSLIDDRIIPNQFYYESSSPLIFRFEKKRLTYSYRSKMNESNALFFASSHELSQINNDLNQKKYR